MTRRYLAISNWFDKTTGIPKTTLGEISEGVNKNGKAYQITETNSTMTVDETHAVGTIVTYTMTVTPGTTPIKDKA